MAQANVTWGAPRICNELAQVGIEVAVSSVSKYMPRRHRPPSPTWRAFLENHLKDLVALDFFVVPTPTFGVLFGLIVLAHHRRRVVHFNVTAHPTAGWTARHLIEAFPGRSLSGGSWFGTGTRSTGSDSGRRSRPCASRR
jgi:hypothetical protein